MKATVKIETTKENIWALINIERMYAPNETEILNLFRQKCNENKLLLITEAKEEGYNQQEKQKVLINTEHIIQVSVIQIGVTKAGTMK